MRKAVTALLSRGLLRRVVQPIERMLAMTTRAVSTSRRATSPGSHAALVTAEDKIAARVKAKLTSGLTTANAAP